MAPAILVVSIASLILIGVAQLVAGRTIGTGAAFKYHSTSPHHSFSRSRRSSSFVHGLSANSDANSRTVDTRACIPPHDTYEWCDVTKSSVARAHALASTVAAKFRAQIPAQLTARNSKPGFGPPSNISAIGLPEFDWGLNCIHGVQSSTLHSHAKMCFNL
jgi:hypothetical protein